MDKYQKVTKPKAEQEEKSEEEIRLTATGSISSYVSRAAKVYNELEKTKVVITAAGNALTKAVQTAEVIKRRFKGLHQITSLSSQEIVDEYEPLEEGLETVFDTRTVPFISITLSKEALDTADKGYQPPIDESLVTEFDPEKMSAPRGRGGGRGKGKGRGEGTKGKGKGKGKEAESKGKGKGKGKDDSKGKGKGKGKEADKGKGKGKGKSDDKGKGKGKSDDKGKGKGKDSGKGKDKGKGKDSYSKGSSKGYGRDDSWGYGSKGGGKSYGGGYDRDWNSSYNSRPAYGSGWDSYGSSSYNDWDRGKGSSKGKGKSSKGSSWY